MTDPAALPGLKLKAERERRGLSAQKAADEMHLDRWVIEALEADDYQRIGPTVYAKGHLKKYAALLGLPATEILAGFESRAPSRTDSPAAGPSMLLSSRDDPPSSGRLSPLQIGACVAVALALGVLWWRPWHARAKVSGAPVVAAAPSAVPAGKPVESGLVSSAAASPAATRETSVPGDAAAPVGSAVVPAIANRANGAHAANPTGVSSAADAPAPPPPGAGHARLRLSFSADSWVDVHDASGKRTFAGNGLANSVKTISGLAPLRVYLGVGSGVQLEINDRAVAIGPQFFAGDVARFEAGADGVLRRDSRPDQSHGAPQRSPRPPG
ncbi:MAG TPA: RodZ domain-containing protein [Steroidobacteraceae bacterium]|nr:RodZ domain-containing protein [Steroidobacteraceae bacterium]